MYTDIDRSQSSQNTSDLLILLLLKDSSPYSGLKKIHYGWHKKLIMGETNLIFSLLLFCFFQIKGADCVICQNILYLISDLLYSCSHPLKVSWSTDIDAGWLWLAEVWQWGVFFASVLISSSMSPSSVFLSSLTQHTYRYYSKCLQLMIWLLLYVGAPRL